MPLNRHKSQDLFKDAKEILPGGVNSPVRAFGAVGGEPLFIERAEGPYLYDADGNRYIDYIGSWGPAIIGHAHPEVVSAVSDVMSKGFSFGAPTEIETKLAQKIRQLVPSMEMMRFVSSGTEACMSALRLARGFTGRNKLIKYNGCYHGHADMLLVKAGSGVATLGIPGSPGVPEGATHDTLVAPFNDLAATEALLNENKEQVAAIIIEPIAGNANFIRPSQEFIQGLRKLCDEHQTLLIFDEVMTGFRVHLNCAQGLFGVKPDLSTFGKVIGGGMPIGVYGGRRDVMNKVAPAGPVYQAGTLSGNPLAVTCGMKTLELLENKYSFTELSNRTNRLAVGLRDAARKNGVTLSSDSEGGMFGFAFSEAMPKNFDDAKAANIEAFNHFFAAMIDEGVYLAPSAYEAGFVSTTHSDDDIDATIEAAAKVFSTMSQAS
ncbi:glutamate-1-semialdehyde 2,1-aminomutase [Pseudobacteriovorax antillogorgiicola]|uniref:Glutamate-1-semialdehyde 2,1-aminomutase n=1 Tax=Pseudobacteriovorax antillogorgiicola TaxID=1513793 RepID=A0A1Y6B8T4_9BACT|nr:glutamate-1-semialdehyde 2,1-aminomutase [Pseudobacteriovorax antillogorgiicola]TCS58602.1 glutamate-1-semialdehyde 2,1-aminomutase [Pseudobacteriovorax antillogorgiicola]SME96994.1 glutamate-1-semialdehyde 2,1-aminomutase [Pseudobacteriovorax antillogorgiicola]